MREAGLIVHDCSFPRRNFLRYVIGFVKFLKHKNQSDIIFVGFLGQFLVPFVKLFTRKPIVFDAFVSIYQTLAFDRKSISPNGLLAKCARFVDRFSCQIADRVILDTEEDVNFFVREYKLDRGKFFRVFAGSDDSVMHPVPGRDSREFLVHFHGEFQPLHGAEYIVEAARLLPDISFQMIGGGRMLEFCRGRAERYRLNNVQFMPPVSYEQLPLYMSQASICLGIFGNTQKAQLVIPHKVYEALAMGKPVITTDTPAIRELLTHRENVYLCEAANPASLANAIKELYSDASLRQEIANNGFEIFQKKCSPRVLGEEVLKVSRELLADGGPR